MFCVRGRRWTRLEALAFLIFSALPGCVTQAAAVDLSIGDYASASGLNAIAIGTGSTASGDNSATIGVLSLAGGANTTAIGNLSSAAGDNSVAIGVLGSAGGVNTTAVGNLSSASGANSSAIGILSAARGANGTAIGNQSAANGANSTAIGTLSLAGADSIAIGSLSSAVGQSSSALGNMSQALGDNSVAIGSNSIADAPNIVSFGSPGAERRLVNVAPGVLPTDAATYGQLLALSASVDARFAIFQQKLNLVTLGSGANAAGAVVRTTAQRPPWVGAAAPGPATNAVAMGNGGVRGSSLVLGSGAATAASGAVANGSGLFASSVNTLAIGAPALPALQSQIADLQTQVDDNLREARAGTALALAASALHFDSRPGKASLSAAFGTYRGASGLAVGLGYAVSDRWRFNAAFTATPQVSDYGFAASASWTLN